MNTANFYFIFHFSLHTSLFVTYKTVKAAYLFHKLRSNTIPLYGTVIKWLCTDLATYFPRILKIGHPTCYRVIGQAICNSIRQYRGIPYKP